jgi:hypothetical protein
MSAIKLSTPSSGSISLSPANTASNLTITVPAISATMATLTTPSFATTIGVGGATPANSGAGITFPATQSASSDANTLDDYEEGTWTPVLIFGGSAGVTTYDYQNGTYTKVGNVVTARCYISIATKSGATGSAILTGLPFEVRGGVANYSSGVIYMSNNSITGAPTNYIIPSSINVQLGQTNSGGFVALNNSNFLNGGDLIIQATYLTN